MFRLLNYLPFLNASMLMSSPPRRRDSSAARRHEVAFEGVLQRCGALGGFGLVDEHIEEVVHDAAVAAAVTLEVVCKELDIDDFFRLAEDADVDFIREHIGFDLTVRAHGLEITVALFGERAHGEAHGCAVLEEEIRLLVVDDVVVAHIDAAAVLTVFQCFVGALFVGFTPQATPAIHVLPLRMPVAGFVM